MSSLNLRPILWLALACAALVSVAYVAIGPAEDAEPVETGSDETSAATSTTAPSPFGAVPDGGTGVVRTASGLVLPVTGGEPGAWQVLTPCARTAVVDGERLTGAHVVLDPGHGGEETGAIAPSGVVEAELNLAVARLAAERLEEAGAVVVLTREAENRVTIETRAAIARALEPLVFVSVHHNGGPTSPSERPGVQVYHQHEAPASARLGGLVFEEIQAALAPLSDTWSAGNATGVRARLGSDASDFYGVLRETGGVPSVLVEALYLSSQPEAGLLAEPEIRAAEAGAIADAIVAWLETERPGSGFIPTLEATESAGGGGGDAGCEDPPELRPSG